MDAGWVEVEDEEMNGQEVNAKGGKNAYKLILFPICHVSVVVRNIKSWSQNTFLLISQTAPGIVTQDIYFSLSLCLFHSPTPLLLPPFPSVVNCTEPGHVENSIRQVLPSGPHRYSFQTTVSYRCNPGYYLLGTSSISCQGDGSWDRSLPKCLCEYLRSCYIVPNVL